MVPLICVNYLIYYHILDIIIQKLSEDNITERIRNKDHNESVCCK